MRRTHSENKCRLVQTVGDVVEYTLDCLDYDDAVDHAKSEYELSPEDLGTLMSLGVVSWDEGYGLLNTLRIERIPDAKQ